MNVMFQTVKVRSLYKVSKQTAGCSNFCTETRLHRPVSVRNSVHPAVCLPSLKRERTLVVQFSSQLLDFEEKSSLGYYLPRKKNVLSAMSRRQCFVAVNNLND